MKTFVLAAATAAVAATAAGAAVRSSAPAPDPATLGLTAGDVPGMSVAASMPLTVEGETVQLTLLAPKTKRWSSFDESVVQLEPDAVGTAASLAALRRTVGRKAGRQALAKSWAAEVSRLVRTPSFRARFGVPAGFTVSKVVVGAPKSPSSGVLLLPITVATRSGALHIAMGWVQVDRALAVVASVGTSRHVAQALPRLAAAERANLVDAFTVSNTSAPTIVGDPIQGQPLTVDEGSWQGAPTGFEYAWQRCDATGAACAPIDGATASTYTPGAADVGATLLVVVSGQNSVSSAATTSAPTAPVS